MFEGVDACEIVAVATDPVVGLEWIESGHPLHEKGWRRKDHQYPAPGRAAVACSVHGEHCALPDIGHDIRRDRAQPLDHDRSQPVRLRLPDRGGKGRDLVQVGAMAEGACGEEVIEERCDGGVTN